MSEAVVAPAPALWLVDKPAGPTSHDIVAAARRRPGAQGEGGALRHPRPLRHRPAGADGGARHPPGAVPDRAGQDLPGHAPDRPRLRHAGPRGPDRGRRAAGRRGGGGGRAGRVRGRPAPARARRSRRCTWTASACTGAPGAARRSSSPSGRSTIHALRLVEDLGGGRAVVEVRCGDGTYVRRLAGDIGERLGSGAYCAALRRTRVGALSVEDAVPVERGGPRGGPGPAPRARRTCRPASCRPRRPSGCATAAASTPRRPARSRWRW